MSELRRQLDQARDAYRDERYPGDLASEILSPPRKLPVGWIIGAATLVAAMAAAVALYVGNVDVNVTPPTEIAVVTPTPEITPIPELPTDVSLIPQAEPLSDIGA